jgi:hypothetical protein
MPRLARCAIAAPRAHLLVPQARLLALRAKHKTLKAKAKQEKGQGAMVWHAQHCAPLVVNCLEEQRIALHSSNKEAQIAFSDITKKLLQDKRTQGSCMAQGAPSAIANHADKTQDRPQTLRNANSDNPLPASKAYGAVVVPTWMSSPSSGST